MSIRRLIFEIVGALCLAVSMLASCSASALAAGAPVIASESVSRVGYSTATMQAEVNPAGSETTYRFEYGATASYGTSAPVPDGVLEAGTESQSVSQQLANLQPGGSYHYRVVAKNAAGTADGPDQVFETFMELNSGAGENCPNEAFRVGGLSATLPDCRAYELVSPSDKNDADIAGQDDTNVASASGNAVEFFSHNGFADTRGSGGAGSNQYIAYRGASGWETHAIMPTAAKNVIQLFFGGVTAPLFSAELDRTVLSSYALPSAEEEGDPNGTNVYVEDVASGRLETVTSPEGGAEVTDPFALFGITNIAGGSSDLSVVAFQTPANFLPATTGSEEKVYAKNHGKLELVSVLPDGSLPAGGAEAVQTGHSMIEHNESVSADGNRIFFVSPADGSAPQQLYMREDGTRTVWISQSEASTPNTQPQGIQFQASTPDGNSVAFRSSDSLLDEDPGGGGYGLYLYTNSPDPAAERNLTFIGRFVGEATEVLAMSPDGKRIYFSTGEGVEEGNARALYIWDEGRLRLITDRYKTTFTSGPGLRASSDGERAAFFSQGSGVLPAPMGGQERVELYLYDAPTQTLKCVSCPSHGASVVSNVDLGPEATTFGIGLGWPFPHRFISSNGRFVFFSTAEALVPQDTNGLSDLYEYNADTGQVALISSGAGDYGAWFAEAGASGEDVFFLTRQSYSRLDKDELVDLYDARVNGGLPEPAPPSVPCAGDACQGTPSGAPTFNTASGFEGLGNVATGKAVNRSVTHPHKASHKRKVHPAKKRKKARRATAKRRRGAGASHRTGR